MLVYECNISAVEAIRYLNLPESLADDVLFCFAPLYRDINPDDVHEPEGDAVNEPEGEAVNQPEGEAVNQPEGEAVNQPGDNAANNDDDSESEDEDEDQNVTVLSDFESIEKFLKGLKNDEIIEAVDYFKNMKKNRNRFGRKKDIIEKVFSFANGITITKEVFNRVRS